MLTNLPIKDNVEGEVIKCEPYKIDNGFILFNSNGYHIEIIQGTLEGQANQIARIVTEARDKGFEQGLASVRRALGIKL